MKKKYNLFIFTSIFLITIKTNDLAYEVIRTKNSSNFKYVPLSIHIDFQMIENNFMDFNQNQTETLKKNINKAKKIIESLLSVNYQYHILIPDNSLGKKCNNYKLNNIIIKQLHSNLVIIPLVDNNHTFINNTSLDYYICNIFSKDDKRPIIATLTISPNFLSLNDDEILTDILHIFLHILGFRQDARENTGMKNLCEGASYENIELKKVAKKYFGVYSLKVSLFNTNKKFLHFRKEIEYDIMSLKSSRDLNINEFTLRFFQNLKWYRVNMNICGCSLNGECALGVLPYEIYINKGNLQLYCYRNEVFKEQCLVNNNIFYFNLKKYNDKELKSKRSYFINDKCKNYDITYDYNVDLLYKGLLFEEEIGQPLNLIYPKLDNYCKCHLKTVYLDNEIDKDYNNYVKNNYKLEKIIINDSNKIVYGSFTTHNTKHSESFRKTLQYNDIFLINNEYSPNILFSLFNPGISLELLSHLSKYTIHRGSQLLSRLGNKNRTYNYYIKFKKKYPKDFDYMPESYSMPNQKQIVENIFKNYVQKDDDLWLCKKADGSLGEGIYFLKNYQDFLNCSQIITKYIHNPHLYQKRKYHIRMYNFISSIKPLIIYIYKEGQVMKASHDYKYNLEEISDKQNFLTNAHINFGKDGYFEDISLEELKKQIIKEGGNWDSVWNQLKDICIKIIITIYDDEYNKLKEFTKYKAKTFMYFGLDVLIDENFKVWFLEANDSAHMEGYDKVNLKNKIGISTDIFNILGIIPFDHSNNIPLEKNTCDFKDELEEKINNIFCEFNRPNGNLERIFPVKETLSYYQQFFVKKYKENEELWKLL